MKTLHSKNIILYILLIPLITFSQNNKSVSINNIHKNVVWPAVYKTFKDLKLKYPHINKQLNTGETNFFHYNTMLAKNRAKYKLVYTNSSLTISLFNRQYLSKSTWVDNPLPISKKQAGKLLNPIKNYIHQLLENKNFISKYNTTTNNITNTTIQNTTTKSEANKKIELKVEGDNSLKTGGFGEKSEKPLILYATSSNPEIQIQWKTDSKDLIISLINEGDLEFKQNKSGVKIYAFEGNSTTTTIIAFQEIENTIISSEKIITIIKPNYYYFPYPSCDELLKLKLISKNENEKCLNDEDKCEDLLFKNNDIILENDPKLVNSIISEHILSNSKLVDPDTKLNSEKLNFVRKLWKEDGSAYPAEEVGQFRDFVKVAPCMAKWSGKDDREKIILLANEGYSKVKAIENQIEGLKNVITTSNYKKIAIDIEKLKKSIIPIKEEYVEKIDKIASKRTIKYETSKSDEAKYYRINNVEVFGCGWGDFGGPFLKIEIQFSLLKSIKTYKRFNRNERFNEKLWKFFCHFKDTEGNLIKDKYNKPKGWGFTLYKNDLEKNIKTTTIGIDFLTSEIEVFDFFKSNARNEKID